MNDKLTGKPLPERDSLDIHVTTDDGPKIVELQNALTEFRQQFEANHAALQGANDAHARAIAELAAKPDPQMPDVEGMHQSLVGQVSDLGNQLAQHHVNAKAMNDRLDRLERAITSLAQPRAIPKPPTYKTEILRGGDGKLKTIRFTPEE
jgi:small-conductance mechanosensitive channel